MPAICKHGGELTGRLHCRLVRASSTYATLGTHGTIILSVVANTIDSVSVHPSSNLLKLFRVVVVILPIDKIYSSQVAPGRESTGGQAKLGRQAYIHGR